MDEFILSDKYIDFLLYDDAVAEFLEGTTFAGKTTVGVPKFMFKVARSLKKFHILAGLDLGTIEKNIIQKDNGILATFGSLVKYCGNGDKDYSMPHIKYKVNNDEKIIFVVGYDNKARWKKVLGGQYGCLYVDEFNIADMDFIREVFMRCDYRIATLNPDDPNKECYKQYVDSSRPIEKYKNDAPQEIMNQLNQPEKKKWVWWYFSFEHNASLTEDKKEQIIGSVPKGTKLYKNKILGLRGKATGLVFNVEKHNIISELQAMFEDYKEKEPKKKRNFVKLSIGCDTSYSSKSHDKLTFELIGITDNHKCILLEEESYNNKEREIPFAPSDVIPKLVAFAEKCKVKWGFAKDIFIDSADSGTIAEAAKYKRKTGCIYNFVGAWKKTTNLTRVQLEQSWLKTNDFFIVETCKDYLQECDAYSFTEDGQLEDGNDHNIQGCQYAWLPFKKMIGNWEVISQLIKDV